MKDEIKKMSEVIVGGRFVEASEVNDFLLKKWDEESRND